MGSSTSFSSSLSKGSKGFIPESNVIYLKDSQFVYLSPKSFLYDICGNLVEDTKLTPVAYST
ncbi:hypothetical protein AAHH67_26480 [Niallia circulans]